MGNWGTILAGDEGPGHLLLLVRRVIQVFREGLWRLCPYSYGICPHSYEKGTMLRFVNYAGSTLATLLRSVTAGASRRKRLALF
jgi:hypothetical protein